MDNRNPGCSSPTGADGEICSLQNFGSANAAKECARCRLPSFAANEPDSQRIILVTNAISEKQHYTPSPRSSPRKLGEADEYIHAGGLCARHAWLASPFSQRERIKVRVSRRALQCANRGEAGSASTLDLQFLLIHAIHGRALLIGALQSPVGGINPHPPLSLGKGEATIRMHRVPSI